MKVPFYKHSLIREDFEGLFELLDHPILTTGKLVHDFENKLAVFTNNKYAVGTMSCTHSLELCLLLFGIGPGDEVITTPLTFIATSNEIIKVGAKPVFVDVEPSTGNIDASKIERAITKNTKAIMVVHLYGTMCDMVTIKEIADKYRLRIIEDSAHCLEGVRDGVKPGNLSEAACYSFYATKNITSGEGGAITVNDSESADKLRVLYLHGMEKSAENRFDKGFQHWDMLQLGVKANMSNIQAAILFKQIDRVGMLLEKRETIAKKYENAFFGNEHIKYPIVPPNTISARHLFTIWVNPDYRDGLIQYLQNNGVGVTVNYRAIHLLKFYKNTLQHNAGDFPIAELIGNSTISLPFYPGLKEEEQNYVIEMVEKGIKNNESV